MTELSRVRCVWQGWPGAPGYSNFYTTTPGAFIPAVRNFFSNLSSLLPTGLTVQVLGEGDVIEDTTGAVVAGYSITQPAVVTGSGTGNYSGATGGVILWTTDTIIDGRRPIGKTYMVPLVSSAFDSAGSLSAATIGGLHDNAELLVATVGLDMAIWHRPRVADPEAVPPVSARIGGHVFATGARVPDLAAVMRTRRA